MAHVAIIKACNLQCSYCFAKDVIDAESKENLMDLETFRKAKEFALTGGDTVSLIGGEPLASKYILDIMQDIVDDCRVQHSTVFTNGILFDKIIHKFVNKKFGTLINVNSIETMGEVKYNKMLKNLDMLHFEYSLGDKVNFGYNIYGIDFDYQYIIDLCKKYGKNSLRISICVPNSPEHRDLNSLEWFRMVTPKLFEFFEALLENEIVPHYDCNYLPICVPTIEQKELMVKFYALADKVGANCNLLTTCSTCNPVIDILPNLNAVRCFGMSEHLQVPIEGFRNVRDLSNYFHTEIDSYKYTTSANPECRQCPKRIVQDCTGGCLAYKDKLINTARNAVNSIQEV